MFSILNFIDRQRCAHGLVKFRQKKHLVGVRKRLCFGFSGSVVTNTAGKCPDNLFRILFLDAECPEVLSTS